MSHVDVYGRPFGAHVPLGSLDSQGALARARARGRLAGERGETPFDLEAAGSCLHLRHAICARDDFTLFHAVAKDIEAAGYRQAGDALGLHRSRKHLQIWGDALSGSHAFASLITKALEIFDLTLVDCWANLYRSQDDIKSWHHDNYQDWTPRPTATIGISLGASRALAFQNAQSKREHEVWQENGDIFAFDEPFNNFFKHSVPPATTSLGQRISVILFVNEQTHVPRTLRVKQPGMRDCIPLEVYWETWDTCGLGSLCRRDRCAESANYLQKENQSWYEVGPAWVDARCFPELEHIFKALAKEVVDGCQSRVSFYSMPKRDPLKGADRIHSQRPAREDKELLEARQALTLQGAQQVFAILRGKKLIENRAWRIPVGWYAIHAGAQLINDERAERIRTTWPDAPAEESLPHSAILGLFYVHSHTTPQACPSYVWARGPICHVISKAVELPRPVHCRGGKGLWDLEVWQLQQIHQQLAEVNISYHDLTEVTG